MSHPCVGIPSMGIPRKWCRTTGRVNGRYIIVNALTPGHPLVLLRYSSLVFACLPTVARYAVSGHEAHWDSALGSSRLRDEAPGMVSMPRSKTKLDKKQPATAKPSKAKKHRKLKRLNS